jgi:hypothetical protein
MKLVHTTTHVVLLFGLIVVLGCAKAEVPEEISRSEAHKKFLKICKEDYELKVLTREFEHTLWVYLPVEEGFFELKANQQGPIHSREAKKSPTIRFLDGRFDNDVFYLEYDIGTSKVYQKDFGYSSTYTERYRKEQRNILTSLNRAYNSLDKTAGHKVPDFFVIVVADVVKGIESRMVIYFEDLKRAFVDASFGEEYTKRVIMEYPTGNTDIISDKQGQYIKYYDLTWGEFLAKQMVYRIQTKYQRSAFPPSEDTQKELLAIVAQTVSSYEFDDFRVLKLTNLVDESTYTISKDKLLELTQGQENAAGRFHVIEFR